MSIAYAESAWEVIEPATTVAESSSAVESIIGLIGMFFPLILEFIIIPAILIPILVASGRRRAAAKAAQEQLQFEQQPTPAEPPRYEMPQAQAVPPQIVAQQPAQAWDNTVYDALYNALEGLTEEQLRQVLEYARFLKAKG